MTEDEALKRMIPPGAIRYGPKMWGILTLVKYIGKMRAGKYRYVLVRCRCGIEKVVERKHLVSNKIKSCGGIGCKVTRTHGQSKTPTWTSWMAMRSRCLDPKSKDYQNWGGRGITICERWNDFALFIEDMGERPTLEHEIDRFPNNDGNYEPTNCRWATKTEQANNRRSNTIIEFNGETLNVCQWADRYGIDRSTLCMRLTAGWTFERAIKTSVRGYRK